MLKSPKIKKVSPGYEIINSESLSKNDCKEL